VPNVVTSVKDQGDCKSGWAFSAVGALEGLSYLAYANAADFSVQQLIDCSSNAHFGNNGCNGGVASWAFKYVMYTGITTSSKYPYIGRTMTPCQRNLTGTLFKISKFVDVLRDSCAELAEAVFTHGPISVAVDATKWGPYESGIFSSCPKYYSVSQINQAVLLVGVTKTFWKIKNSWGTGWGESGYMRLSTAGGFGANSCGICTQNAYPIK
jgi:cathepsin L